MHETSARVVLDASAIVRGVRRLDENAAGWLDAVVQGRVEAEVPELAFAEVANSFALYAKSGTLDRTAAQDGVRLALRLPVEVHGLRRLTETAFDTALALGLTVYDAYYATLAEATGAVLLTADRRLAEAVDGSALLPNAVPPAG